MIKDNDIKIVDTKFYDARKRLKYLKRSCDILFSVGERDVGKSTDWKKTLVKDCVESCLKNMENGIVDTSKIKMFAWVKPSEKQLIAQSKDWAKSVNKLVAQKYGKEYYLDSRKSGVYLMKKVKKTSKKDVETLQIKSIELARIGIWVQFWTPSNMRSGEYENIEWFVFDEFQLETGLYLPNEFTRFMSVLFSLGRHNKRFKVILIGNDIDDNSPYHIGFNIGVEELPERYHARVIQQTIIDPDDSNKKIVKRIFIENAGKSDYVRNLLNESKVGRILSNTDYAEVASGRLRIRQSSSRVISKPRSKMEFKFNLIINGFKFKVNQYAKNEWYITQGYEINAQTFYGSIRDSDSDKGKYWTKPDFVVNTLRNKMQNFGCWFDSRDTETIILDWMKNYK